MITKIAPQMVGNGTTISVTTSAGQKTGLPKGTAYWIFNIGDNPAFINTDNKTATATTSMPIFNGECSAFPIITSVTGTINHISTTGGTTLTLIKADAVGSL